MTEISNNELKLLAENQHLKLQLSERGTTLTSTYRYLAGLGMAFYVALTIMTVAIQTTSKQAATITQYEEYIDQQEVELQDYSHELFLLKNNSK